MVRAGMKPSAPVSSSLTNSRPGHPGNAALEGGADPIGEEVREQAVEGLALRLHGAPLGDRDGGGDLAQRLRIHALGERAVAKLAGADQAAVDHQIRITADRRGEMGVAAQAQPIVAVVLGAVFGLRLGAQHHLVDQLLDVAALHR